MWSKQSDSRNANMTTSLKNKITNRKRKNSKSSTNATAQQSTTNNIQCKDVINNSTKKSNKKNKQNKKLNKNDNNAKSAKSDEQLRKIETFNENDVIDAKDSVDNSSSGSELVKPDVILEMRNKLPNIDWHDVNVNNIHKRYSDSFVLDNENNHKINQLSRAQSGFFLTNTETCELLLVNNKIDKNERKSRRFSDLFRHSSNMKSSNNNCDVLKNQTKMVKQNNDECHPDVTLRKKNVVETRKENGEIDKVKQCNKEKKNVKIDKNLSKDNATKIKKNNKSEDKFVKPDTNTSYLKRVKSKIYKHKNENVSVQPSMPNISENVINNKKNKNKKVDNNIKKQEILKSNNAEFRLLRQSSNLERVRPKSFMPIKSSSNVGISELVGQTATIFNVPSDKPILAKSKSSSSINLNYLRTRRNKILDFLDKNRSKMVEDEFEFIAFGDIPHYPLNEFGSLKSLNNNDLNKWNQNEGDTKPGHPVTRTGSDRRPDAVREESRTQDGHNNAHDNEDDTSHGESSVSLPAATGNKRRISSNINRSESVKEQSEKRKQRRNISDPLHNTKTTSEVDLENPGFSHSSGSSSNSSLSSRSSETPSTSYDATSHPAGSEDSDLEVEADPPDWQSLLTEEELSRLQPLEKKRQDVINELFHTERSHVRNLKVLELIFWKRLSSQKILKYDEMILIFSNLGDLLHIHTTFNTSMKQKRKEEAVVRNVGDLCLTMFDGAMGENFQKAAAAFCERQQLALEFIKDKRKKDSRFDQVLSACETDKLCRRLPLQGFIPSEMQRLSKYPLLLERLIDIVQKLLEIDADAEDELKKLKLAYQRSKEILNYVNEAAKEVQSRTRLDEIQRHLDTSLFEKVDREIVQDFKNLDLTKYKLLHEGTVSLIRANKTSIQVHLVLLEGILVMLQKEGEKYLLKFFQSGTNDPLAPIIKLSHLIVRPNAAVKDSLFLINTTIKQMYNLRVRDPPETKRWIKYLSDAADSYNKRDGKFKRPVCSDAEEETVQELPSHRDQSERAESVGGETSSSTEVDSNIANNSDSSQRNSDVLDDDKDKRLSSDIEQQQGSSSTNNEIGGGETVKLTAEEWPFIRPLDMQVTVPPVHTAESVLTPLEQIKRKDEEVRKALADKEVLVADLLSIPREDFHHIADMASEETSDTDKEPYELVLAAVYQSNKLLEAVNDSLNLSETDPIMTKGGKHPSCASNENAVAKRNNFVPQVPGVRFKDIATMLNSQLTNLLSVIKQREEDRDRLRKELHKTREQLHENLAIHRPQCIDNDENALDCSQSGDLERIEESPTENEN